MVPVLNTKNVRKARGFTLVELMVVILVIGILAAVAIPLMQGRIDKAKWSEASSSAGTIRRSVRAYAAETTLGTAQGLAGSNLGDATTRDALGFRATDLEGTYFIAADYAVTSVNGAGVATITVAGGGNANSPTGTYVLQADGDWVKQ